MKKALFALIVLVVLVGTGSFILYKFVSPSRDLDLDYEAVPIESKAIGMLKNWSTELVLSQADVNNLAKASIASNPQYSPDVLITGADFRLVGENRLAADLNLKIRNRIPVGMSFVYRLEWQEPNLTAVVEKASIRGISLPAAQFDNVVIPLGDQVPDVVHIKSVTSDPQGLKVAFRKPSLSDIRDLIGGL